ncbi:hypothetical protein D1872_278000 [compost metagenome]
MCDIPRGSGGTEDWCRGVRGLSRNSTHNMNSEFETQTMDVISQRSEADTTRRRGKTILCWHEAGVGIHL